VITYAAATNNTSGTQSGGFYTQIQIVPSIGHVYVIHPVNCGQTNSTPGLYRGVGKAQFVRADFDSLVGQYWQPITNDYTMVLVTNSKAVTQRMRRVVTQPDFLLSAADLTSSGQKTVQNVNFDFSVNAGRGLAGPGTINPVTRITYDKAGPLYKNSADGTGSPYFILNPGYSADFTDYYSFYFVWASFDGTTNTPVVYPNGTSIDNLQNQLLVQFLPDILPLGISNVPYGPAELAATGGSFTPPFTWSENDGVLGGIGLTLESVDSKGVLSGTPTQSGAFDFIITLTDVNGRTVQWPYTITIQ
jgi:hypothetical protein